MSDNRVTLKELKVNLKDALKKSGVLDSVKAQIRKDFINNMHNSKKSFKTNSFSKSLFERALFSSIYHCIKSRGLVNTLSVFAAECGIDTQTPLSELDIIQSLQYGSRTGLYNLMKEKENKENGTQLPSVLELLIQEGVKKSTTQTVDAIVQTNSGQSVRDYLLEQNMEIHKKYMAQLEEDRKAPVRSIEERMLTFERECEDKYRKLLDENFQRFKEEELIKVRAEEKLLSRSDIQIMRKELENEYSQRLALYSRKEDELIRKDVEREKTAEKMLYEGRQQVLKEMDDLKLREQTFLKKMELETQALRLLESRLKESQLALDHRSREVTLREQECDTKLRECSSKAREDAQQSLKIEMESLMRDRISFRQERDRFEEDKRIQSEVLTGYHDLQQKLRETQAVVITREEELVEAKQKYLSLLSLRNEDEAKVADMLNVSVESLIGPNTKEYLVRLTRRILDLNKMSEENNSLRKKLGSESIKNTELISSLSAKETEANRYKTNLKQVQEKFKSQMILATQEVDEYKQSIFKLESQIESLVKNNKELEELCEKQQFVTSKLNRLGRVNSKINSNVAAFSSSFGGGGGGGGGAKAVNSDPIFNPEIDSLLYNSKNIHQDRTSENYTHTASGPGSDNRKTNVNLFSYTDIQELVDRRIETELKSKKDNLMPRDNNLPTFGMPPPYYYAQFPLQAPQIPAYFPPPYSHPPFYGYPPQPALTETTKIIPPIEQKAIPPYSNPISLLMKDDIKKCAGLTSLVAHEEKIKFSHDAIDTQSVAVPNLPHSTDLSLNCDPNKKTLPDEDESNLNLKILQIPNLSNSKQEIENNSLNNTIKPEVCTAPADNSPSADKSNNDRAKNIGSKDIFESESLIQDDKTTRIDNNINTILPNENDASPDKTIQINNDLSSKESSSVDSVKNEPKHHQQQQQQQQQQKQRNEEEEEEVLQQNLVKDIHDENAASRDGDGEYDSDKFETPEIETPEIEEEEEEEEEAKVDVDVKSEEKDKPSESTGVVLKVANENSSAVVLTQIDQESLNSESLSALPTNLDTQDKSSNEAKSNTDEDRSSSFDDHHENTPDQLNLVPVIHDQPEEIDLASIENKRQQQQQQEEEDRALIQAAREKVLARRKQKQQMEASVYSSVASSSSWGSNNNNNNDIISVSDGEDDSKLLPVKNTQKTPMKSTNISKSIIDETYDDIQTGFDNVSVQSYEDSYDGWS